MDITEGKRHEIELARTLKLPGHQFTFRQVNYVAPETSKEYQVLTNSKKIMASEVTAIYKEGWQIELFLKWNQTKPQG
ncbi:hypothetical protein [Desulfopila sp. IMCC35008]|uniref:hypothetical protein n=1 Tax=Desulfopila sp. IMCC35008 TaxID=2653858 RepID=UPI0013D5DB82|nr:hypothetical protein [Desulfopila sp. IMCC35008]